MVITVADNTLLAIVVLDGSIVQLLNCMPLAGSLATMIGCEPAASLPEPEPFLTVNVYSFVVVLVPGAGVAVVPGAGVAVAFGSSWLPVIAYWA